MSLWHINVTVEVFCFPQGEHVKAGVRRSGEGEGLLLREAAGDRDAVSGPGTGPRPVGGAADGGALLHGRTGECEPSARPRPSSNVTFIPPLPHSPCAV